MFAVIKTGGKQYKVAADDVIRIEKLEAAAGDTVTFGDVLMVGGDSGVSVGEPMVDGASVAGEVVEQTRGKKILVFKKKRRQNYRRTKGHRQLETVVKITEILTGGAKPKVAKKAAPKAEKAAEKPAPKAEAKKAETKAADAKSEDAAPAPLFDTPAGAADDLKKITGVGPVLEKKLNALGITQYAQIAAFSADDIQRVDEVLNFKGRIERDGWIDQAKTLAEGGNA